jgi:hypothetical protein
VLASQVEVFDISSFYNILTDTELGRLLFYYCPYSTITITYRKKCVPDHCVRLTYLQEDCHVKVVSICSMIGQVRPSKNVAASVALVSLCRGCFGRANETNRGVLGAVPIRLKMCWNDLKRKTLTAAYLHT